MKQQEITEAERLAALEAEMAAVKAHLARWRRAKTYWGLLPRENHA